MYGDSKFTWGRLPCLPDIDKYAGVYFRRYSGNTYRNSSRAGIHQRYGPAAAAELRNGSTTALIMLAGIYYGSMYGGSTTSILVNVPGESSSVMTCLDGYQMAKRGRGGAALAISAVGSFIAGTIGIILLTMFAPPISKAALAFGPPEYLAISLLGLIIMVLLSGSLAKGFMMMLLGVVIGTIGLDP